jgi:hypothetical protein
MMSFLDNWVLKPDYLPAWLQAAAATVALVISVWAVLWTSAATRRRERLELRGVAVAIYPEIAMLKVTTQNVRLGIAALRERYGNLIGQSVAASLELTTIIQVPPMLERNIDRLFILGDVAGPSCLHLVRFIMQYNATAERIIAHVATLNAEQWLEAVGHIEQHLGLLDKVIEKCEREVKPIHDSVKG